jgi:hypothetical protein
MNAAEIIQELPKLSQTELRAVRQRFIELASQNVDVALCDQASQDAAASLDRMEEDDARRQRQ